MPNKTSRAARWAASLGCALWMIAPQAHAVVTIETVTVGNPGNLGEWSGDQVYINAGGTGSGLTRWCGAVNYTFEMGKYEITAAQYTEFLNAVAASDPYGLYHPDMLDGSYECNIQRSGADGSYTYQVLDPANWANRPIAFVEWGSAIRFVNWLHNGQPTGPCGPATTEDGSYPINGRMTNPELQTVVRRPGATWVLPSEDEWYKAAYHWNDGPTGNYWNYPTQFGLLPEGFANTGPQNDVIDPDPGNSSNHYIFDNPADPCIGPPYWRTLVGEFENSASPYGTFDQGGNQWEWTDSWPNLLGNPGSKRIVRGGSYYPFIDNFLSQHSASRGTGEFAMVQNDRIGFRVAKVNNDCNGNGVLDQTDLRTGTSHDYNLNGRPDECDIALGSSTDCDANGIPDEADTGHVTVPPYRWSDGNIETPLGMVAGGHMCWLNYYAVVPGRETISAISVAFDLRFVALGAPFTVCLWADPDSDGNPDDATVLASVATTVDGTFRVVDIPNTYVGPVGTGFFVGALMEIAPESYPAALDSDSDHQTSWLASSGDPGLPIDPNNLAQFSLGRMNDFGYPGNWLVDALSDPAVAAADCNHNSTPDACDITSGASLDVNGNGVPDECESPTGVDDRVVPPAVARLQVHPNPFNPSTEIRFEVSVAGPVSLEIFDLAGRLVRTLVNEKRTAASHVVTWDGTDNARRTVASGAYYCRMNSAAGTVTAKLMLLK